MAAPKAVTASTKRPGFYLFINLLAGAGASGVGVLRALLVTHAGSGGDIGVESEVRTVYGADDAQVALGKGTPGHLAAIKMFEAFGDIALDIVAMAAPNGDAASGSFVVSGTPTTSNYFDLDIAGRKVGTLGWAVGETEATFATRIKEEIAGKLLPVTPATGSAASIVDIDAVTDGAWGNDITYGVKKISGSGGTVTISNGTSSGRLADGAGESDPTTALSLVVSDEYAAIGLATSNADAADNTANAGPEILMEHIEGNLFGGASKLQYGFVGHTGSIANAKAGAIGRNSTVMTYAYLQNAQSLPCEVMGWELGDALRWYTRRANYNRINNPARPLIGSRDRRADKLTPNECEDLLRHGVSPYDFAENSADVFLVCPITTHSLDGTSPDYRCFYQSDVFGEFAVARDLRSALPQEFPNCSISEDLPAGIDSLPEGVVERRDVEAFSIMRIRGWVPKGVVDGNQLDSAINTGRFVVEIDDEDPSQVNIFIPNDIVKPLAKFSVVMHKLRLERVAA